MTEHIEFQTASTMLNDLVQRRAMIIRQLQDPSKKGDIHLNGTLNRIQNDIQELDKVMSSTGMSILNGFEAKYGCKFKFLAIQAKPIIQPPKG